MFNNIAFIGGIHGVGKSTICRLICDELNLEYLSASDLLKWKNVNADSQIKNVSSIPATQERLLIALTNTVQKDKFYLLDGHYCLLNLDNDIVDVPLANFKTINPVSLYLIVGHIAEIKDRLEKRDGKPYNPDLLRRMQIRELDYAKHLSKTLGINLSIGSHNDFTEILTSLRTSFATK